MPLTDLDQEILARARDRGELGTEALLPRADVVERVNDKYLAHEFFEANGVHSPPSWLPDDVPRDVEFPVLVKARQGFGSSDIYRAENREQLDFFLGYTRPTRSCRSAAAERSSRSTSSATSTAAA